MSERDRKQRPSDSAGRAIASAREAEKAGADFGEEEGKHTRRRTLTTTVAKKTASEKRGGKQAEADLRKSVHAGRDSHVPKFVRRTTGRHIESRLLRTHTYSEAELSRHVCDCFSSYHGCSLSINEHILHVLFQPIQQSHELARRALSHESMVESVPCRL
eukprot:6211729-Pleurochrysis_carterae.AAC.3